MFVTDTCEKMPENVCNYGKVGDSWPNFDESSDLFYEMTRRKDEVLRVLHKEIQSLAQKMDEK